MIPIVGVSRPRAMIANALLDRLAQRILHDVRKDRDHRGMSEEAKEEIAEARAERVVDTLYSLVAQREGWLDWEPR